MNTLNKKLIMVAIVGSLTACSTMKHVDTDVDSVQGNSQSGIIALKDGKAIIQEQTQAADELRWQQFKNYDLERDVMDEYLSLKQCREELADTRLGGNGEITALPEIDNMKTPDTIKEEFGLNKSDSLVFVKKEDFNKKIEIERNYETSLHNMMKTLKPLREKCDRQEGVARVKAGLPAHRFEGKSMIDSEGNISKIIQRSEHNLDDAFDIKNQKSE